MGMKYKNPIPVLLIIPAVFIVICFYCIYIFIEIIVSVIKRGENKMLKCYQPEYNEKIWDKEGFFSWFVFSNKSIAEEAFPKLKICEYKVSDIENPDFIDQMYKKERR